MKANKLSRKKDELGYYYFDMDQWMAENNAISLYQEVINAEEDRIFRYGFDNLGLIANEIQIRTRITKHEIFKIGELLMIAKKVCRQDKIGFQQWIEESFDFSYETAKNFMNVWKNCLAYRTIALEILTSILYQISRPSFPDELREYLFTQGNLEKITQGKVKTLITKYKEGGLEAIEKDLLEVNRILGVVYRQSNFTIDMCINALRILEELKDKIMKHSKAMRSYDDFFLNVERSNQPEAYKINKRLYYTIDKNIDSLEKAIEESRVILDDLLRDGTKNLKNQIKVKFTFR